MNSKMIGDENALQLAYEAARLSEEDQVEYGKSKRQTHNPLHNAATLSAVITHLYKYNDVPWIRDGLNRLGLHKNAYTHLARLSTGRDIQLFLDTVSLFLKAIAQKPIKKKKQESKMPDNLNKKQDKQKSQDESKPAVNFQAYKPQGDEPLSAEATVERAWAIWKQNSWTSDMNLNKMTKLEGRLRSCQGKWECLAVLAQYFPLKGISKSLINQLVDELSRYQLRTFQNLVGQLLVFYAADNAERNIREQ